MLLPFQEEEAQAWSKNWFDKATVLSPLFMVTRAVKRTRAMKQKAFQSAMLIQPVTKDKFTQKVISMKSVFGENSVEAETFYNKYVDSYDWGE